MVTPVPSFIDFYATIKRAFFSNFMRRALFSTSSFTIHLFFSLYIFDLEKYHFEDETIGEIIWLSRYPNATRRREKKCDDLGDLMSGYA